SLSTACVISTRIRRAMAAAVRWGKPRTSDDSPVTDLSRMTAAMSPNAYWIGLRYTARTTGSAPAISPSAARVAAMNASRKCSRTSPSTGCPPSAAASNPYKDVSFISANQLVEPGFQCLNAAIGITEIERCLGAAQEQVAVRLEHAGQPAENGLFCFYVEIDHDIANEDQIHARQDGPGLGQIHFLEIDHATDRRLELPIGSVLVEILH